MATKASGKGKELVVLVSVGQNKRRVTFTGSKKNDLFAPIQETFCDVFQSLTQEISHLQLWDNDFEDFVDLDDQDEIQHKSKIKVILKVRSCRLSCRSLHKLSLGLHDASCLSF